MAADQHTNAHGPNEVAFRPGSPEPSPDLTRILPTEEAVKSTDRSVQPEQQNKTSDSEARGSKHKHGGGNQAIEPSAKKRRVELTSYFPTHTYDTTANEAPPPPPAKQRDEKLLSPPQAHRHKPACEATNEQPPTKKHKPTPILTAVTNNQSTTKARARKTRNPRYIAYSTVQKRLRAVKRAFEAHLRALNAIQDAYCQVVRVERYDREPSQPHRVLLPVAPPHDKVVAALDAAEYAIAGEDNRRYKAKRRVERVGRTRWKAYRWRTDPAFEEVVEWLALLEKRVGKYGRTVERVRVVVERDIEWTNARRARRRARE
jgi:hypothetical protein